MNDPDWSRAAPSLDAFAAMVERAWAGLPDGFRAMAGDVVLQVADWPDDEMLDELDIEDAYELTGLYQGWT